MPVSLRFFGPPVIIKDGETVSIHRQKTIALLAYLAVTGTPQTRERVCDIFWPTLDDTKARAGLRTCLSEARCHIAENLVCCKEETLFIRRDEGIQCDVVDFLEAIGNGKTAPAARNESLVKAAGLYTGPFLQGLSLPGCPDFDDWQFENQQLLMVRYTEVLEELVRSLAKEQRTEVALTYAQALLEVDSTREDRHRRIMELHAARGDCAAALGQFEILKHLLQRNGGGEPETETLDLAAALADRLKTAPDIRDVIPKHTRRQQSWIILAVTAVVALAAVLLPITLGDRISDLKGPVTIAVLPFKFLCLEEGAEKSAESFTSELITTLAGDPAFAATPHVSVRQYTETIKTVSEIARELDVDYILDGATQKHDNRIRFSVQLIDTRLDECIWAETYEEEFSDELVFQREITDYLVKCIKREIK